MSQTTHRRWPGWREIRALGGALTAEGVFVTDRLWIKLESGRSGAAPTVRPSQDPRWLDRVHDLLHIPKPCLRCVQFGDQIWPTIWRHVSATTPVGKHRHDADPSLVAVAYALAAHLNPASAVETGVARGLTSAAILAALEENKRGRLYSVDLPPLTSSWSQQIGVAVTANLHQRWSYIRGSARRRLPQLLRKLGTVDLFVHDSLHTYGHMQFEFRTAWSVIAPGGALLADDVHENRAFQELIETETTEGWLMVAEADKDGAAWGLAIKPGGPDRRSGLVGF